MRDRSSWYQPLYRLLIGHWPKDLGGTSPALLCKVELGLRLLHHLDPDRTQSAGGAWTLLSGYPFARAAGLATTPTAQWMLTCARHRLWDLRGPTSWREALQHYREIPFSLRAYEVPEELGPAEPYEPALAAKRLDCYDRALGELPDFRPHALKTAGPGRHLFASRSTTVRIDIPVDLANLPQEVRTHDIRLRDGNPERVITVPRQELAAAAAWMSEREEELAWPSPRDWVADLENIWFDNRSPDGKAFRAESELRLDGLLHMVGMVGAGKSTLMLLLAVWAARRKPVALRVTLVVGDVAEQLRLTTYLRAVLGDDAAGPVVGYTTRERHVQGLHRRLAAKGRASLLNHSDEEGFDSLSTACPLDAVRDPGDGHRLSLTGAPCSSLHPFDEQSASVAEVMRGEPQGCPLWHGCPRHGAARSLVTAGIWVANMASLVASRVPAQVLQQRMRHLELACLRSDIVIVDEADRVMMNLDDLFAPSATLVKPGPESWLDRLDVHSVSALANGGRRQLADHNIDDWDSSLSVVTAATNRIYAMLINDSQVREWVGRRFFNAGRLQHRLLLDWFPATAECAEDEWRQEVAGFFAVFRDDPLGESGPHGSLADRMAAVTEHLLHAREVAGTHRRVAALMALIRRTDASARAARSDVDVRRFQFTLLLSALHHRLNRLTYLWPRVESVLGLDSADETLVRRPPLDYAPIVPESPMGNVLGFQYHLPDEDQPDGMERTPSGTLRYFRCAGVGRELLLTLSDLAKDPALGRPGPHVLLMSGTSWAGESTRAHIPVPVGTILRPRKSYSDAVLETVFTTGFLYDRGKPLSLSGSKPDVRPAILRMMLDKLAQRDAGGPSLLERELRQITDPARQRVLILVGSYDEAERAAAHLRSIQPWQQQVRVLTSDSAERDATQPGPDGVVAARSVRRGDVASLAKDPMARVLVAPLLALERGHNILNRDGKAAFGTILFLARPHPVPDDITLSVFAINDWAARFARGIPTQPLEPGGPQTLDELVTLHDDLGRAGDAFRRLARDEWTRLLNREYRYGQLKEHERRAFVWDQLVTMWQVIGRLVRGGVPARVVFVDAKFAPRLAEAGAPTAAAEPKRDTARTSLLVGMREVLAPYFGPDTPQTSFGDPADRDIVKKLYEPIYRALCRMLDTPSTIREG
ncbi:signal recognition particle [Micromonospora echinospora]|uniref:pPIWI_RE_Z domain-containing protein n=1 Tax=Micromonospora echinospora TaxID=1877 RepID=UPI003671BC02